MSSLESLFSVRGLHVLITGGGSGLGLMMAKAFVANGAVVYIVGRSVEKLEKGKKEVLAVNEGIVDAGEIHTIPCDLTSSTTIPTILAALGPHPQLDVLINCAGIAKPDAPSSPLLPLSELQTAMASSPSSTWSDTFSTNVEAPYRLSVGLLHLLAASDVISRPGGISGGRIINISSIGATMSDPAIHQPAYQISKTAVNHLTRLLASKFRALGVRVNAISPGYFPSEMNRLDNPKSMISRAKDLVPLGRAGREEDLMATAVWLAGRGGDYVDGQVIVLDGGRSWA